MTKEILFEEAARNVLRDGINTCADVVAMTLGPRGRNIGLQAKWGAPTITSDGHSIAKEIESKDPFLNLGISMSKEVAGKIKEKAGDGTTTGIVLLRALVTAGLKNIAAGANPTSIKRGMDKALHALLKEIDAMATLIKTNKEIQSIATVSASGNAEIGEKIALCFEKVGKEGVIAIEEGKGTETGIEIVEGLQFDRGYASAYFCTNQDRLTVEMQNPYILLTDKKITSAQDILPILQQIASLGAELLIVADDIEGDALSTLVVNKLRGTLKVACVKAPGFGDRRKAMLEDLAILTGGQVVTEEKGLVLREAESDVLGRADQITITKDKTTVVGGKGNPKEIRARIAQIDGEIGKATSTYDKEKLQERKGKLQGGVALIKVGASTEPEMKKKKQMYEDSLHATQAALEEGFVAGGGVALLHAGKRLKLTLDREEAVGAKILVRGAEDPFRQIVSNAGHDPSLILEQVLAANPNTGFNALTESIEDLVKAGIVDPVKVVKTSLTHAVSMAGIVLLSESVIFPAKED